MIRVVDSDEGGLEGVDGGLALALDAINNSLVVSVVVVDLHKAGLNGRVPKVRVRDHACEVGKDLVVRSGDVGTCSVNTAISPASLEFGDHVGVVLDEGIEGLLGLFRGKNSTFELWLGMIDGSLEEPEALIALFGCFGGSTVLVGKVMEYGKTLVPDSTIVIDERGELATWGSVSTCCFGGAPFFKGKTDILELNTLMSEEVADGLGATLKSEVDELGHPKS